MVPDGRNSAASLPSRVATRSCSALADGSSPYWSSPTGAAAIAERIAAVGRVTVSERRSIGTSAAPDMRGLRDRVFTQGGSEAQLELRPKARGGVDECLQPCAALRLQRERTDR